MADQALETHVVEPGQQGIWFRNGAYVETLPPGRYAFWKNGCAAGPPPSAGRCGPSASAT
jgi:hypothetical protein